MTTLGWPAAVQSIWRAGFCALLPLRSACDDLYTAVIEPKNESPPFGSWPRTYLLVCVTAVVIIALLLLLTIAFNKGRIA
ncbi:MAG: hypothetical protein EXS02_10350 [Planctomycetes bacterium]|nr:hypothetical protein [Planctomycetota bacterium]